MNCLKNIILFFFSVFTFSFTLYAQDKVELCGETACGTGEYCGVDESGAPACMCLKGYTLVNNACVIDECVKADCPENGYCTADYGFAECNCKEGYYLEKYKGTSYCLSNDTKNYDDIVLLNEMECQSFGICKFRLDLEYPANMLNMKALSGYYFSVEEIEEKYEGFPFAGYLNECLKDGFCEEVSEQMVIFTMIFPTEGKRDINVSLSGMSRKGSVRQSITVEVNALADACYFKGCPEGSWCEVEGEYAFCRGNEKEEEGSLSELMQAFEEPDGGGMAVKGMVSNPQEQFWYHLSESSPGTSSCQNAPSYPGSFCGEWFLGIPRGLSIPDNNTTGITRTTNAANFDYILSSVTVYVNITHTWRGDLWVAIYSPKGTEYVLHDRTGGSEDNLSIAVNVTDFNNENPEGTWTLKVKDLATVDTGRLTEWGVKLNSSGYKRINDSSINKRHGEYNGALFQAGVISNAVGFEGTDDRIWAGQYMIPESFTITGWIYPDSVTGVTKEIIHARKGVETENPRIRVMAYNSKLRAYVNDSYLTSSANISTATWTHIAVSFEKTDSTYTRVKIYLNNVLDSDSEDSITQVADTTSYYGLWSLGAYLNSDFTYQRFFDGKLDEFRVYDSVLSRAQRDAVYDYGCSSGNYRGSNKACGNTSSCGDGRFTSGEECEDAGTSSCNSSCQLVDGYYPDWCFNSCENTYYQAYTQCGDDIVAGDEECDDGNTIVETCPVYNQSCTVCGSNCTDVAGIKEYCGDYIVQNDLPDPLEDEECDGVEHCTGCQCDTGYEPGSNPMYYHPECIDICLNVNCGPTGTCDNSTGSPVCSCGTGYVARNNFCEEGWFEDENLAAAVVDILQRRGVAVEDELDIDPSYMFDDINYLYLGGKEISSLVGIELFPNLIALDVSDNNITDIWPLGQNESLIELNLSENPVTDGEILSTLINLESLNITNTRIYHFAPVKDIPNLQRIFISNENYDPKAIIRPENLSMEAWFLQEGLDGCFKVFIPPVIIKHGKPVPNNPCSDHGTCVMGQCVCNQGYHKYYGDCVQDHEPCLLGFHFESDSYGGGCYSNKKDVKCDLPPHTRLYGDPASYEWNGSSYMPPSGKTEEPCYYNDDTCNGTSICLYHCETGFAEIGNGKCESVKAYRDIAQFSSNKLREPVISRNDVTLEPIPGVPSFVPTLNYREDYLSEGWYLNFPRVELRTKNYSPIYNFEGWDKKVYVNMPWGSEEYSIIVEDVCVDSNNNVATCTTGNFYLYKIFPSPGQNVFSYIEMKVKVGSFGKGIETYPEDWKVTRYGDDGSVTKFERTVPKPSDFIVMDYIPITEYTTRDGKKVTFEYLWEAWHGIYMTGYKHHIVNEILITDSADRAIRVSATGMATGLFGRPDKTTFMTPLKTEVNIYTGVLDGGQIVSSKRIVRYTEIDGFDMQAYTYKDNDEYRMDEYKLYVEGENIGERQLISYDNQQQIHGMVVWKSITEGYIEYRKVSSSPEKWIKKDLHGPQYVNPFKTNKVFPVVFNAEMDGKYEVITTYSEIEGSRTSGVETKIRKTTEKINNWFKLTKREVCSVDSSGECTADLATEKFGYNVNGSISFYRDYDNSTRLTLYNNYDITPYNYNTSYKYGSDTTKSKLKKAGKPLYSVQYSKEHSEISLLDHYMESIYNDITYIQNWTDNGSFRRVTSYLWNEMDENRSLYDVWDLGTITYPDETTKSYVYDYNGKVIRETINDGADLQPTCYQYNSNGMLLNQGIVDNNSCVYKKGFSLINNVLLKSDYSYIEGTPKLENRYYYDTMGRKIGETNSAGVTTVFHYDSLNRIVQTDFGCTRSGALPSNSELYTPEIFNETYPLGEFDCEYSRYYYYDEMNNLFGTLFEEKYSVTSLPSVVYNEIPERFIGQLTEYDLIGRPVKNCQFDDPYGEAQTQERCIETEHDVFGNITKKVERGEVRAITYDHRDRPLIVTVDGLQIEEYVYNTTYQSGALYGYDEIINKYNRKLTTYFDKWGRSKKQVDPFLNKTYFTYDDADNSDNLLSQITFTVSESTKTGETVWTYDDLGRKLSEVRKQFEPGVKEIETNINHWTAWEYDEIGNVNFTQSSNGTRQFFIYDSLNRLSETINEEHVTINGDPMWVDNSTIINFYDVNTGRLYKKEINSNDKTIKEEYEFDTLGRVNSVATTDSTDSETRKRYKLYNTGGQVIWEADEEADSTLDTLSPVGITGHFGNEKYYIYNEFGDMEKTIYVMTDNGTGRGTPLDTNPWIDSGKITTSYGYDSLGRIVTRTNDRSGTTTYSYYDDNVTGSWCKNKIASIQIFPAPEDGDGEGGYEDPYTNEGADDRVQTYAYTYDAHGDEVETTYTDVENSYSMTVELTRDGYGRITSKTSYGSNPVTQTFSYIDNGIDRNLLVSATDSSGVTVSRSYDSFGIPYTETVTYDTVNKIVSREMLDSKTYQFTYPDAKVMQKVFTAGQLDAINYGEEPAYPDTPPAIATYTREDGYLTGMTKGLNSDLTETFTYNEWNKLSNHKVNDGSSDVYDMTYGYSRAWHLTEKTDGKTNRSDKYTYDSYYRLKQVDYDVVSGPARTDIFRQDGVHNLEQSVENSTTWNWGVDKLNRLREKKNGSTIAVEYDYDARNNMTFEDHDSTPNDRTYVYDDLNRLIEVKDGSNNTIALYKYDAFNRRIIKTVGTTNYRYTYDDWNIAEIETSSTDYTNVIDAGMDNHIAIEVFNGTNSEIYYFLTDERGNVVALTDDSGNIVERYRYRVYGEHEVINSCHTLCETTYDSCFDACNGDPTCEASCLATKNTCDSNCAATDYAGNVHNFLWGGSLYEPETNLYWMRNRYYHKDMHRFINQDPIGIWGDANNLGNGFAYVAGMVIEASDPTGLDSEDERNDDDKNNWQGTGMPKPPNGLDIIEEAKNKYSIDPVETAEKFVGDLAGKFTGRDAILELIELGKNGKIKNVAGLWEALKAIGKNSGVVGVFDAAINSIVKNIKEVKLLENGWYEIKTEKDTRYFDSKTGKTYRKVGTQWYVQTKEGTWWDPDGDWEECEDPGVGSMPSGPDSGNDAIQDYLRNNMLKEMLKLKNNDKKSSMEELGPVIKHDDNGRKVFIFNPYYRGKDPMDEIIWRIKTDSGMWGFVRNPFAPGDARTWSNTYEMFEHKGFVQPEVDPYFK